MSANSPGSRPLGRPRDPGKVDAIVEASWRLFLAHGVEPVSVETIAAEAGVAKATVYSYFPDKQALFQEGVRREMAKIEAAQGVGSEIPPGQDLRTLLIAFGGGIMNFLTNPRAIDFYGSLSSELRRDPGLARMFFDAGPGRTQANLAAILASPLARELSIPDPDQAAETLLGMWQGMSSFRLMLGIAPEAVRASIPHRVEDGVDRFLRAYAPVA